MSQNKVKVMRERERTVLFSILSLRFPNVIFLTFGVLCRP